MNECICGTCPACRREMRELERAIVKAPTSLSPLAAQILAEPAFTAPAPSPTEKPKTKPKPYVPSSRPVGRPRSGESRQDRRNRKKSERVEIDGKMVHPDATHGTISGYSDYICRCELCAETNRQHARARYAAKKGNKPDMRRSPGGGLSYAELKEARRSERVMVDGVLVHPTCNHGTAHAFDYYGCKCKLCNDANNTRVREYKRAQKENKVA